MTICCPLPGSCSSSIAPCDPRKRIMREFGSPGPNRVKVKLHFTPFENSISSPA